MQRPTRVPPFDGPSSNNGPQAVPSQRWRPTAASEKPPFAVIVVLGLAMVMVPWIGSALIRPLTSPFSIIGSLPFDVQGWLTYYSAGDPGAQQRMGVQQFFQESTDQWEVFWDERGDRPQLIEGVGVPMLPGLGNQLRQDDLGFGTRVEIELSHVEQIVRDFIDENPDLFRMAQEDLVLNESASGNYGERGQLWFVEFQQYHDGVPVADATVTFRLNNGNLVQFGGDRVGAVVVDTTPAITAEDAFAAVLAELGRSMAEVSEVVDSGTLKLYPTLPPGEDLDEPYGGEPGEGYDHTLGWEVAFLLIDDPVSYHSVVDAQTGVLRRFIDNNWYAATVKGGIYPETYNDTETTKDFSYTTVDNNGTSVTTDSDGEYTYSSGTATCTLDGKYTKIADNCGAISLSDSSTGDLDFGTHTGTNCTTPGSGGSGNTHAARTAFYHLTQVNRVGASHLSSNDWLKQKLTANINIDAYCNAFWSPSSGTVNFYRSGSVTSGGSTFNCGNTGEIAAIMAHEWGHGLDSNTSGGFADRGTGEAVADICAFNYTKKSCLGKDFWSDGSTCNNCSTCTGVRDVADFAQNGSATIASPANVTSDTGINCDAYSCPYPSYMGVMGYEGHCESYIASTAVWDLGVKLRSALGTSKGWSTLEQIWYDSMPQTGRAYRIVTGGKCNPNATVNGCGLKNFYTVFLSVDDDNGNLSDGTPNACRIWDALNAHGIACGNRPSCTSSGSCSWDLAKYAEDFADGVADGFLRSPDLTNLWEVLDECRDPASDPGAYLFTEAAPACSYDLGPEPVVGTATSPVIDVSGSDCAWLEFNHTWETESWPGAYDVMRVEVSTDGGVSWRSVGYWDARDENPADYVEFVGPAVETPNGTFQFRFTFDSIDEDDNDYLGWVIDDVVVRAGSY